MKLLLIFAVLAALGGNPAGMLKDRKQQKTLETLKDLGGEASFCSMDYKADYRLQDFIDADLDSKEAVSGKVMEMLLNVPASAEAMPALKPACSAFQARTPDGDVIYARNFDYIFRDGAKVMMRTSPRKGYKSLSMVSMSFLGLEGKQLRDGTTDLSTLVAAPYMQMDGMNSKGLAVSVLCVLADYCAQQYDTTRHTIMTTVMMRMLLDRAATVDEAVDMLGDYNYFADGLQRGCGEGDFCNYHFLLSDATGKSVVIEYLKRDGPGSDSPWELRVLDLKAATNFFLADGWRAIGGMDDRYGRIMDALDSAGGILTEEEAMHLLDQVHQKAVRRNDSRTQWSVVYNLTRGTATVCVNHDYSKTWKFSIKKQKGYEAF